MAQNYYTLLTTAGFAAVSNALALRKTVNITQMAVGDGNGAETVPASTQKVLVHETYRAALNSLDAPNDSQIMAEMVIPATEGGFTIREVGLYDDGGILLAVANFPATYKPTPNEGTTSDLVIRMLVNVGNASVVNITIDPSAVIATRAWVLANTNVKAVLPGGDAGQIYFKNSSLDGDGEWRDATTDDIDGLNEALAAIRLPVTHDATNVTPADAAHGAITTPTLVGSPYYPLYDVPQSLRRFQVDAQGTDFSAPIYEGTSAAAEGAPATSHTVAVALALNAPFAWRYRDENAAGESGEWSAPTNFTTSSAYVAAPVIITPADGSTEIAEQPVIQLGDFAAIGGVDTLRATSVRVKDAGGAIIWELIESTDPLNNIPIPAGTLQDGATAYTIEARYHGTTYGASAWSVAAITTMDSFLPDFNANIGMPYGGGYIAGEIVSDYDGHTYGIIVSPAGGDSHKTGSDLVDWCSTGTSISQFNVQGLVPGGPLTYMSDGFQNYKFMDGVGAKHWVEQNCNTISGLGGYNDWYIPARDELDLLYRNFKPTAYANEVAARANTTGPSNYMYPGADGLSYGTNTHITPAVEAHTASNPTVSAVPSFSTYPSADAFYSGADYGYWSSTIAFARDLSGTGSYNVLDAWTQNFQHGGQLGGSAGTDVYDGVYVRAIRRVLLKK